MPWVLGESLSPTYVDEPREVIRCEVCHGILYDSQEREEENPPEDTWHYVSDDEGMDSPQHKMCPVKTP